VTRLAALGVAEPYPIQSATLPDALAGRDVCAQSPTGSGKTLSFAIPLVTRVGKGESRRPRALVLAPARELAAQIAAEVTAIAATRGRSVATFYGGTGFGDQIKALRHGTDVAVGCPGRLIDLVERKTLDLRDVEIVVIDEADRMADMGFQPAVCQLLDLVGGARQTMLYSATLSRDVERLVRRYQNDPVRVVLDTETRSMGSRTHTFWRAAREERPAATARLVAEHSSSIVFCRTRRGVDRLTRQLTQAGIVAVPIHGDRTQSQRDHALAMFRDGRAQVLVGTDVASRGLHIGGVDCVVHFDPPEDEDTYVHRSGRTGRSGSSGFVVSLVTADQETAARQLQRRLCIATGFEHPPTGPRLVEAPPTGRARRAYDARTGTPALPAMPRQEVPRQDGSARRAGPSSASFGRPGSRGFAGGPSPARGGQPGTRTRRAGKGRARRAG
jgi:superfamily II DNA/RNA helicase